MKPDYNKYKLRKVVTKTDKQKAIEKALDILEAAFFRTIEVDYPEAVQALRKLVNILGKDNYYVGF